MLCRLLVMTKGGTAAPVLFAVGACLPLLVMVEGQPPVLFSCGGLLALAIKERSHFWERYI